MQTDVNLFILLVVTEYLLCVTVYFSLTTEATEYSAFEEIIV